MYNKQSFFITFEGIEGSGKTYLSKKLYKSLIKKKISTALTREPGGSSGAEKIRKIILTGAKNKFTKTTDTLLYLAARNEHFENKIKNLISKKRVVICDRFTDSTLAYQVYGKGVNNKLVDGVHRHILGNFKPDLTFIIKVNIKTAFKRLKKRSFSNRYDKFSKYFYSKVQNAFIRISRNNKKRYIVLENSAGTDEIQNIILRKVLNFIK